MDKFDLEAEAEGNARRRMVDAGPATIGRRSLRDGSKRSRGAAIVGCHRVEKFTVDHTNAVKKYTEKA
jgi:hypothetical protein